MRLDKYLKVSHLIAVGPLPKKADQGRITLKYSINLSSLLCWYDELVIRFGNQTINCT